MDTPQELEAPQNPEMPRPTAPTPAGQWRKSSVEYTPLEVPSGNICLVKPTSMKVLIAKNRVPNNLVNIVRKAMENPKEALDSKQMIEEVQRDPAKAAAILDFIDAVIVDCVIEPEVQAAPKKASDRDVSPERTFLYVDEVDEEDKIFIWQYAVGGTRDLETFRQRQDSYMEFVPEVQVLADPTE